MKTALLRSFVILMGMTFLSSCIQDSIEEPSIPEGAAGEFNLTNETYQLSARNIVCYLLDENHHLLKRKAFHTRYNGISRFELEESLPEGRYLLLFVEFPSAINALNGADRLGIGRYLLVENGDVSVEGTYNMVYQFGGSGTESDPFLINCDKDLYMLQAMVNDDGGEQLFVHSYFKQTADIDLFSYSYYTHFEYGWMPIGKSNVNPFQGFYDGNGKKITGLFINRANQSGVGLFGVIYNGSVSNLIMEGAEVTGDGAVGGIVGAVVGDGASIKLSTVSNCRVTSSTIKGNVGVGGVVGMADALTHLGLDSCFVDASNKSISGSYGVGGILGGGTMASAVSIYRCENRAAVEVLKKDGGGIAGVVDTAIVASCVNYGAVTASKTDEEVMGIGGVVGGAGMSNLADVHNYGAVKGYRGVGGIVGSTLITGGDGSNAAVYNNVFMQACHNEGNVEAVKFCGGLCGEAQLAVTHCYNKGNVSASDDYVGGIVGQVSVSAIHNANNFGNVQGNANVGGIAGKVTYGSFAINTNFGNVTAQSNYAGGIFGRSGNQSMLHYCGNYGAVTLSGNGAVGGLIGEIGDPREWSGWDITEVVLGSLELVTAVGGAAFCIAETIGAKAVEAIHISHTVAEICLELANSVTLGYSSEMLNHPEIAPDPEIAKHMEVNLEAANQTVFDQMEAEVRSFMLLQQYVPSAFALSPDPLARLADNRARLLQFYNANEENHEYFNDKMDETRLERYEEVEANKRQEELIHTIVQGICMAVSLVTLIGASVASGGAAIPFVVAGMLGGVAGGANAISKSVRNFEANTVEISQCYNFGQVVGGSGDVGGLVGVLQDFSCITDCLNGGAYSSNAGAIAGHSGGKATITRCLDLANQSSINALTHASYEIYTENNRVYCSNMTQQDWQALNTDFHNTGAFYLLSKSLEDPSDVLYSATVNLTSSYKGWDFTDKKMWNLPDDAAAGSFPIPNISKMTKQ